MKPTGNMERIGRRWHSVYSFGGFFEEDCLLKYFLFALLYVQVASLVRNRSVDMVEALYNMNRVCIVYANCLNNYHNHSGFFRLPVIPFCPLILLVGILLFC